MDMHVTVLPEPELADDADAFAAPDRDGHVLHGVNLARRRGEANRQVGDLQKRGRASACAFAFGDVGGPRVQCRFLNRGSSAMRSPSPR